MRRLATVAMGLFSVTIKNTETAQIRKSAPFGVQCDYF